MTQYEYSEALREWVPVPPKNFGVASPSDPAKKKLSDLLLVCSLFAMFGGTAVSAIVIALTDDGAAGALSALAATAVFGTWYMLPKKRSR